MPDPYRLDDEDPLTIDRQPAPTGQVIAQAQLQASPNSAPAPAVEDVAAFAQRAPDQAPQEVSTTPAVDPYARPIVDEPVIAHARMQDQGDEDRVQARDQVRAAREQARQQRDAEREQANRVRGMKQAGVQFEIDENGDERPRVDPDTGRTLYKPAVIDPFAEDENGVYAIKRDVYGDTHKVPLKPKIDPTTGEKFVIGEDGVTKKSLGIDESFVEKRDATEAGKVAALAKAQLADLKSKQKELKDREKAVTEEIALNASEKNPTPAQQTALAQAKSDLVKLRGQMAPLQKQYDDFAPQADAIHAEYEARRAKVVERAQADYAARNPDSVIARALAGQQTAPPAVDHPAIDAIAKEPTVPESGDFMRGLKVSLLQIAPLAKGTIALLGATAEKALGEGGAATAVKQWGLKGYADGMAKAGVIAKENDDVTKAWEKAKGGDVGALVDWAQYGMGYLVGQAGETAAISLIAGLAGGAATSETGPGAAIGAGAGVVAGAVAKQAVKTGIKGMIEKLIVKTAGKLAIEQAEATGAKLTAQEVAEAAATTALRKQAASHIAQNTAMAANSLMMEAGGIFPDAVEQSEKDGKGGNLTGTDLARVWATSIVAGGIDALTDKLGFETALGRTNKVTKALGGTGRIGSALRMGAGLSVIEGGTEFAQTVLERIGSGQNVNDEEGRSDIINSTLMGMLGGGGIGGPSAVIHHDKGKAPRAALAKEWNAENKAAPGFQPLHEESAPVAQAALQLGTDQTFADRHAKLNEEYLKQLAIRDDATDPVEASAAQATLDAMAPDIAELGRDLTERRETVRDAVHQSVGPDGGIKAQAALKAAAGAPLSDLETSTLLRVKDTTGAPIAAIIDGKVALSDTASEAFPATPAVQKLLAISRSATAAAQTQQTTTANANANATNGAGQTGPVPNQSTQTQGQGQAQGASQGQGQSVPAANTAGNASAASGATGGAGTGSSTLPANLAGAQPKYSHGQKRFDLNFASDIDKAAYITAQASRSKHDAEFLKHVMDATGMTEEEVRAHGRKVRDSIKAAAATAQPGVLNIADHAAQKPTAPTAPAAAAPSSSPAPAAPDHASVERAERSVRKAMDLGRVKATLNALTVYIDKRPTNESSFRATYQEKAGRLAYSLQLNIDRLATKTAGMTNDEADAYVTAALGEEVTHLAQFEAVRRAWEANGKVGKFGDAFDAEYADVHSKMSDEEKEAARAAYGRDIDGAELGAEFVRQLIQQGTEGRITEATHAAKPIIERILAVLKDLLANPASRSAALQRAYDSTSRVLAEIEKGEEAPPTPEAASNTAEQAPPAAPAAPDASLPTEEAPTAPSADESTNPASEAGGDKGAKGPRKTRLSEKKRGALATQIHEAWTDLKQEQGFSDVSIADLQARTKIPIEQLHEVIRELSRQGVVHPTLYAPASHEKAGVLEAAIDINGQPHGRVSFSKAPPAVAETTKAPAKPAEQPKAKPAGPAISDEAAKALDDAFEGLFASEPGFENREVLNAEQAIERLDNFDAEDPETWPRNLGRGVEKPQAHDTQTWEWALSKKERTWIDANEANFSWIDAKNRYELDSEARADAEDEGTLPALEADLKKFNGLRTTAEDIYAERLKEAKWRAADLRKQVETHGFLYSSEPVAQQELPPEKIDGFVKAARALISSGIDTPEGMASALETRYGGKARPYSEALWDAFGMVKKSLRGTHDWDAVYAKIASKPAAPAADAGPRAMFGKVPLPVSEAQWEAMTHLNAEEQMAKYGTTRAKLIEEATLKGVAKTDNQSEANTNETQTTDGSDATRQPSKDEGAVSEPGKVEAGTGRDQPGGDVEGRVPEDGKPAGSAEPDGSPGRDDGGGSVTGGKGDSEAGAAPVGGSSGESPTGNHPDHAGDGTGVAGGERNRPESLARSNYHLADPERLVGGGPKARFERNRAALETFERIQVEQREPTPAELDTMAAYMGWGSFGQELFQGTWDRSMPARGWEKENEWLRDHLSKAGWQSAQDSIINAHYTDPPTVNAMWRMVERLGFAGGRVLEPSMGVGNFFALMPREMMAKSDLTGIEMDMVVGGIAKMLYPQANVQVKGYQDSRTADNFYDLVIGNWPFAKDGPSDRRYNNLGLSLHDYFFVKALDQVRPGGFVIGITSSGTMDKKGETARRQMAKRAELVASFRLPTGAFEKYAGTKVVTDLIILKKREQPLTEAGNELWIGLGDVEVPGGKVAVNQYYIAHPENVLGELAIGSGTTFGRAGMIVNRQSDFADVLAKLQNRLPADLFKPWTPSEGVARERTIANSENRRQNAIVHVADRADAGENGFYVVRGEQLVNLEDVRPWQVKSAKETAAREADGKSLVGIADTLSKLLDEQRTNDPKTNETRAKLKAQYDAHVAEHGHFVDSTMLDVFARAGDPNARSLRNLEAFDGKEWKPRDILLKDIMRRKVTGDTSGNVSDAYIASRNDSISLDLDRVAELAKVSKEEVVKQLVAHDQIYQGPDRVWYPREEYLGGNVRQKLREALDAKEQGLDMDRNIKALEAVQPRDIPYLQIEVQMGAAWVPKTDYDSFAAHLLGIDETVGREQVRIMKAMSGWDVRIEDKRLMDSANATTKWGIARHLMPFSKILQAAMNGTSLTVTAQDENKKTYTLTEETKAVNAKIDAIREEFAAWLWRDADRTGRLTRDYNETLNAEVNPQRSGSHLRLEGLALTLGKGEFDFRQHQKDAVWRFLQDGRGVAFHEVGTGKTFTIAGLAMEGRRLGRFRKPILFAHNANHRGVAADMTLAYPGAKVLHIDNLSPENRDDALRQIGLDDWDLIVMPHSLLDRFTLRGETLMDMAREQIAQLENEIYAAAHDADRSLEGVDLDDDKAVALALARAPGAHTAKNLVKMRKRIIKRILDKAAKAEKSGALLFEDLGIDSIMVDEAHMFKKVALATRKNLKGLNKEESGRGWMLNALTGYVKRQNSGKGVFLFTGTPLTNNLNEAFTMMQFVMDDVMEQAKVKSFDDWFNSFAAATTDVELTSGGTLEPVTRLLSFVNVPELARMASRFFDVVLAKDMPEFVERKSMDGMDPDAVGRPHKKMKAITAEMSPLQAAFKKRIEERYKQYQDLDGKGKRERALKGEDTPVLMDGDGAKSAMDHRLVSHDPGDDFAGSKLNKLVRQALIHFHEHEQTTQAIFMENGFNDYTDVDEAIRDGEGYTVKNDEGETLRRKVRRPAFNLIRDMVQKLVDGGVDPSQIAVLSNMKLDASQNPDDVLRKVVKEGIRHPALVRGDGKAIEKDDIAAAARDGKIRFLIGSTQTLGTGVNAQTYMRAMHHLDAPWTPGEFEQRNGRGWRQGNQWNTVHEYRYFTEGSHDGRRWQVLLNKVRFIQRFTEMLRGKGEGERVLTGDGADLTEKEGDGVSDFASSFSTAVGDPRIQIRAKLEADVKKLTERRSTFLRGLEDAKERAVTLGRDIERQKGVVAMWSKLLAGYRADQAAAPGQFSITVGDQTFTDRKKAEARIEELPSFIKSGVVGKIGSFEVYFDQKRMGGYGGDYDTAFSLRLPGVDTQIDLSKFSVAAIEAQLRQLPSRVETYSKRVSELTAQRASIAEMQGQTFSRQDELEKKQAALEQIKAEMSRSPLPAPAWLRNGVPVGSLVYLKDKKAYEVVAHRRDESGYWLLLDENGVMKPVRYLNVYDEAGTRIFDPVDGDKLPDDEPAAPKNAPAVANPKRKALEQKKGRDRRADARRWGKGSLAASEPGGPVEVGTALVDSDTPIVTDLADAKGFPDASEVVLVNKDGVHWYDLTGEKPEAMATAKVEGDQAAIDALTDASIPKVRTLDDIDQADFPDSDKALVIAPMVGRMELFDESEEPIATAWLRMADSGLAASEPFRASPSANPAPAPAATGNAILEAAMKELPPVERKVLAMKLRGEPDATIERVTKLNAKGVENAYKLALGKMARARAQAEKVGAVFTRALAEKQPFTLGRPDLANPATGPKARRFVDAVDADRGETATREQAGVREEAKARLEAGYAKERRRLLDHAQSGGSFGDLDTAMAKMIVSREALRAVKAGTLDRVYEAAQFVNAYRLSGTEQARGMAMRRDWTKSPAERAQEFIAQAVLTPPQKQRDRMEKNPDSTNQELKDWARQMKRLKQRLKDIGLDLDNMSDEQIAKFLEDKVKVVNAVKAIASAKADIWDALYEYWVSSILSGPATNVANIAGNTANAFWDFTAQRFAEAAVNLIGNDPNSATFGEMRHIWAGFLPGMADGFRRALRSWREEVPVFDAEVMGMDATSEKIHSNRAIPGKFGRVVRMPLRLLLAADEMSKSVTARMQVGAEAYRLGKAKGLQGPAMAEFMRAQMTLDSNNPSDAWRAAAGVARTLAFQEDLGNFGNSVIALRDSLPGLRYFMPFIKTIANIFKIGVRKSPLGTANMLYRLGKGAVDMKWNGGWSYTRKEAIAHTAEQMLAWGMFVALAGLAAPSDDDDLPTITGTNPYKGTKKGERDLAYRTAPPTSIRIGGEWYSYGRIEPFATGLSVMVDSLNVMRKAKDGGDFTKTLGSLMEHMTAQLKDKTFARGIGDVLNAIEDGASLAQWSGNFATSWVPNIIRAGAKETDDLVREQKIWGRGEEWAGRLADRIEYNALPIAANAPPAKVDLWGREIAKDQGISPATDFLYRLFSPARKQPAGDVLPIDRLIVNWNNAHPDEVFAPEPPDPKWEKSFGPKGAKQEKTIYMTDAEYNRFLQLSGRMALARVNAQALNVSKPTRADLETINKELSAAHKAARDKVWEERTGKP